MPDLSLLPIDDVLPDLLGALRQSTRVVLAAEPGAGKTTRVPLALLDAAWRDDGKIIMLEPRRLAARSAAGHMAHLLGEDVGQTVGYRVRMDSRISAKTRIELVTEGVFIRMLQDDPSLEGVAAVLFDEFHERSLDADLGLALALDCQDGLRDDLRILVMSATLDTDAVAGLLDNAPVICSTGRSFPVELRHEPRRPDLAIEDQMAETIRWILAEETGSLLCFLPGEREIRRVAERLGNRVDGGTLIAPLYGRLDRADQDRAISRPPEGRRKVVLATDIAETSLTIDGIRVVIDSGLSRKPIFDPASGISRLETVRVSQAAANQRRGRAGRLEPGLCIRLWHEGQTAALRAFDRPEILETDLSALVLGLLQWGVKDPQQLRWLDPPPAIAWREARDMLLDLGLISAADHLTELGVEAARLPVRPRLAALIAKAAAYGQSNVAARLACLIDEPGLGGRATDLEDRLQALERDRSPRAKQAKALADRWSRLIPSAISDATDGPPVAVMLAWAFPDRIARRRGQSNRYLLSNGKGAFLPEHDSLGGQDFLVIADVLGQGAEARILSAAPLLRVDLENYLSDRIEDVHLNSLDPETGALKARRVSRLGQIVLSEATVKPDPAVWPDAFCDLVAERELTILPLGDGGERLLARMQFARERLALSDEGTDWPDLTDVALKEAASDWLKPFLVGKTRASQISEQDMTHALLSLLPWEGQQFLKAHVPDRWTVPTGSSIRLDYSGDEPVLAVRVQELYGLSEHPTIFNGTLPLTLSLLSPAGRPIQITKDLPGFWTGSWSEVAREMRGRYPKHVWPDKPAEAEPTRRAKPRP
ncbi:ATP-dependent helicase HrpB [Coralliovum pocilloporae]|uniref:ATP-dependent helicase HrpB n=1 Tax=Coralliovum pocilloporae TaxID=3066369 RepID=UPI0033071BEA